MSRQSGILSFATALRYVVATLLTGIVMLAGAAGAQAAGDGYIFTPITGAQTQIDVGHTSSFTITASSSTVLKGGNFTMKSGTATFAPISLTLYQLASDNTKTLITSADFANATAFCAAHGGNCGNFAPTVFNFLSPVAMSPGKTYLAELTSSAADTQSNAYFIKGGQTSCFVATSSGTLIPGTNCSIGQNPPVSAPILSLTKTGTATVADSPPNAPYPIRSPLITRAAGMRRLLRSRTNCRAVSASSAPQAPTGSATSPAGL